MFGVADSFADSGYVVVAIDLPLHGVTNTSDPLYAAGANPLYAGLGLPASGSIERTFDLDVENNTTGAGRRGRTDRSVGLALHQPDERADLARQPARGRRRSHRTHAHAAAAEPRRRRGINPAEIHYLGHSLGRHRGRRLHGRHPAEPRSAPRRSPCPAAASPTCCASHPPSPRRSTQGSRPRGCSPARRSTSSSSAMRRPRSTPEIRSTSSPTPPRRIRFT